MSKSNLPKIAENFANQNIPLFATPRTSDQVLNHFTNDQERAIAALAQGMTWNVAMKYAQDFIQNLIDNGYELVKVEKDNA